MHLACCLLSSHSLLISRVMKTFPQYSSCVFFPPTPRPVLCVWTWCWLKLHHLIKRIKKFFSWLLPLSNLYSLKLVLRVYCSLLLYFMYYSNAFRCLVCCELCSSSMRLRIFISRMKLYGVGCVSKVEGVINLDCQPIGLEVSHRVP